MRERPSFVNVLNDLATPARSPAREPAFANPLASAAPPLFSGDVEGLGVDSAWDHAFAWAAPDEPEPAPAPSMPRDDLESIAAELDLAGVATSAELDRARRDFMWRHHPDRRPDIPRELANRRVAIANMLIDKALLALSQRGRRDRRPVRD